MYGDNVRTSASVKGKAVPQTVTVASFTPTVATQPTTANGQTVGNLTDRGYPSSYQTPSYTASGGYYQALQNAGKIGSAPATTTDANKQVWTSRNNYVNSSGTKNYNTDSSSDGKASNSSGSSSSSGIGAYSSLLSTYLNNARSLAEEQMAAQRAAAQNAYDRSVGALNSAYNSQINNLRSNYDSTVGQLNAAYDNSANKVNANAEDSLRQAYINKMLSQKNLGQQMSAQGLTGGAAESTLASMLNNYGNSRNNIETTKANNLSDLAFTRDNNLAEALRSYNSAIANADLTRANQLMNLENALANNQISAIGDYYGMLASENEQYNSLLKSLIGNMGKWKMTPAEVTNLVNMVNTTQANTDTDSNYAKLRASYGATPSTGTESVTGVDTMANANLLAQLLANQTA